MMRRCSILLFLLIILAISCKQEQRPARPAPASADHLLAEVYKRKLYASELEGMIASGTDPKDSLQLVKSYIETWVRESLLMHEAEKKLSADEQIEKLVEDYRLSLIKHLYEKTLVETKMDTSMNDQELLDFYENNKSNFLLENPVIQCLYFKVPRTHADSEKLRKLWPGRKADNFQKFVQLATAASKEKIVNKNKWSSAQEVSSYLPKGGPGASGLTKGREYSASDANYLYFIKVFDRKDKGDKAPFDFARETSKNAILKKRSLKLLEDIKNQMYELELRRNNIKIYVE